MDLTIPLQRGLDGALTWDRFGGYRVPFLPAGNKLGVFDGTVRATNNYFDESLGSVEQEAEPLPITFHVNPSLVVLDNRAFGDEFIADCVEPSTVLLQMMRYAFRVKALGFEVARFEFVTSHPAFYARTSAVETWVVQTEPDVFGYESEGSDEFAIVHRWAPAPDFTTGYQAGITAKARGIGMEAQVRFPFVVRPWNYAAFETAGQVAEILPPTVISGCIPGGPSSVGTSYEEKTSETRTRSISSAISQDFSRQFGEAFSQTYNISNSQTFAETQSRAVKTGNTAEIGASDSVTDMFSVDYSTKRATTLGWAGSRTTGHHRCYVGRASNDRRTDDLSTFTDSGSGRVVR